MNNNLPILTTTQTFYRILLLALTSGLLGVWLYVGDGVLLDALHVDPDLLMFFTLVKQFISQSYFTQFYLTVLFTIAIGLMFKLYQRVIASEVCKKQVSLHGKVDKKNNFWILIAVMFLLMVLEVLTGYLGLGFVAVEDYLHGISASLSGKVTLELIASFVYLVSWFVPVLRFVILAFILQLWWDLLCLGIKRTSISNNPYKNIVNWSRFLDMSTLYLIQLLIIIPILSVFLITALLPYWLLTYFAVQVAAPDPAPLVVAMVGLGLYFYTRLSLATMMVAVGDATPCVAVKTSYMLTKNHVIELIAVRVVNIGLIILSIIPLGIGLFWSAPYVFLKNVLVYKELNLMIADKI